MSTHPFKNYSVEIVTPVHIGNDAQINPLLYNHEGDFIYLYDIDDVAKHIENPKGLLDAKRSMFSLKSVIGNSSLSRLTPIKQIHYWGDEPNVSHQEMELLVGDYNENFLPGSSIKGSILHAIEFKYFNLMMNGKKAQFFDITNRFKASFAVRDLYFKKLETAIQRGIRVTTASQKSKRRQKQDNYKEWFMEGQTLDFNAYFRKDSDYDVLKAIHDFTEKFLEYQASYYRYILDHVDMARYPVTLEEMEEVMEQVHRLKNLNREDEPLLILGRNTHRYSKSNELYFNKKYQKTPGKNTKHPVSRLLVRDSVDRLTIPGFVKIKHL